MSIKIRTKNLSDGRQSIYLDVYISGTRRKDFLGLYLGTNAKANRETMKLAEEIRAQRQADVSRSANGMALPHRQKANFIDYLSDLAKERGESTGRLWRVTLKHVKAYAKHQPVPFSAVTKAWLQGFKKYLLDNVSTNTAATYFSHVRAAMNQAVDEDLIIANPKVKGIERLQSEREFLDFEELVKLANTPCPNDEIRRAFLYACYTGLRYSDVEKLHGRDINKQQLRFRQKKTKNVEYLPLSEQALSFIPDGIEPDELVFKLPSYDTVNNTLKQWGLDAKLTKKVTFHVARHTVATLMLTNGVDLYTVSKVLGHSSIKITEVYAHMIDKKKQAALASIPALPRTVPSIDSHIRQDSTQGKTVPD